MLERKIYDFKTFSLLEDVAMPSNSGSKISEEAAKKIRAAKFFLSAKYPFFAEDIAKLTIKENRNLRYRTMATDGYSIHYDPGYVLAHTQDELIWVLVHEILHCVLKHFARCPRDLQGSALWNIAADYAINQMITPLDQNALSSGRVKPSSEPKESVGKMPQGALYPGCGHVPNDDKFANMTTEQILAEIIKSGWKPEEDPRPTPPPPPPVPPEIPNVGDVIYDPTKQRYGVVTKVDEASGDLEYDPIPKEKVKEYAKPQQPIF